MLPIHFAPLQGYTEDGYRRIHHEICGGIDAYYSPFLRLEHKDVRSKDMRDIRPEFNEGVPLVPQAIANGGEELQILTDVVKEKGYTRLDINMGCPFPLQTRHGRGAGILPLVDKVKEVCEVVNRNSDIAYSVKMRLGLSNSAEWQSVLPSLNAVPLTHITVHPRIGTQQYKGEVMMDEFCQLLTASQHPVIYNGDITEASQIHELEKLYPSLAGVMIGRGLLARPTLAKEYITGEQLSELQVVRSLTAMHTQLHAHYTQIIPNEQQLLGKLRCFWEYTEATIGRKQWKRIMKAGNLKNYLKAIDELT